MLQVTCRELWWEGVEANVKHAAVFSPTEENFSEILWDFELYIKILTLKLLVIMHRLYYRGKCSFMLERMSCITVACKVCGWPLNFNYLHPAWLTFNYICILADMCILPRTSCKLCILSRMYILGKINIVQDESELLNKLAIKILWSSCRPSYNIIYIYITIDDFRQPLTRRRIHSNHCYPPFWWSAARHEPHYVRWHFVE